MGDPERSRPDGAGFLGETDVKILKVDLEEYIELLRAAFDERIAEEAAS